MPMHRHTHTIMRGFSLVEMSIVMVIMAIVITGGLLAGTAFIERQAYIDTEKQLDEIHEALKRFHARNGRLPCPASANIGVDVTNFGFSNPGACDAVTTTPAGTFRTPAVAAGVASAVRVGALPTRNLGLADEMVADGFGNRFIYAVTEAHTSQAKFAARATATGEQLFPGAITVLGDGANVAASEVSFIVLSTGENGRSQGAYRYINGAGPATCATATADSENCDNDVNFRELPFNNGEVAASYFDDMVRYSQKFMLTAFGLGNIGDECNSVANSIMRYNPETTDREYCDGDDWVDMPDTTSSGLLCLAFEQGMVRLDPLDNSQWQGCDASGVWFDL